MGDRAPRSHVIFLLEELIVHLKLCGSQTNIQQFHNDFGLLGRTFRQNVIVMEFITNDLQGFVDWYISEETDNAKANESIYRLKVNRLQ
jgi:hypothetical protein